jgi:hypothetical protein
MLLMLQLMVERFGGMVQYLKNCCGVSEEDIELIQALLTFTAKDTD